MNKAKHTSSGPLILLIVSFCILIGAITYYLTNREKPKEKQSYELTMIDLGFDTPVTFQAWCTEAEFVDYLEILRERFISNNQLFDRYLEDSEVYGIHQINQAEANTVLEIDPLIQECLEIAQKANQLCEKFDVAQGVLINLWHEFRDGESDLPETEQIAEAYNPLKMNAYQLSENSLVKLDDFEFDLGAIAKGFTVQQAKEELEKAGCLSGYINAGGNVALIGNKPDGEPWKVGILKPDSDQSLVRYISDDPISLVTSGDYQRYVEVNGVRYSHIIDPDTGYPADYSRSVTVFDEDSAWADAMSTTLFLMSVEDGLIFCQDNNLEALWITDRNTTDLKPDLQTDQFDIFYTAALKDHITLVE